LTAVSDSGRAAGRRCHLKTRLKIQTACHCGYQCFNNGERIFTRVEEYLRATLEIFKDVKHEMFAASDGKRYARIAQLGETAKVLAISEFNLSFGPPDLK
jgi:hypothetical protein